MPCVKLNPERARRFAQATGTLAKTDRIDAALLARMPALVAARFNPDLKAKYQQIIAQGKPTKVAITAVMRKLIVIANALIKANRTWTKSLA